MADLSKAQWPLLESLGLRDHKGYCVAVDQLILGRWPLLKKLNLEGDYHLDASVVEQLAKGKWPLLQLRIHGVNVQCSLQKLAKGSGQSLTCKYCKCHTVFSQSCMMTLHI